VESPRTVSDVSEGVGRISTPSARVGRWLPFLLVAGVTLPIYLAFRSISLDDFDSYSFALALERFSLDLQQPQPPGFPVYVFLGRLCLFLTADATAALTLLSALSGVLIAVCLCGLGRALAPGRWLTGAAAALLCGLAPLGWLTAEKALSDAPGLAMVLLSVWLLWRGRDDPRWLGAGSLALGLSLGLRPQDALPAVLLLIGLTVRHLWRRRSPAPLAWVALPLLLGVVAWLAPTLRAVGGLSTYLDHVSAHSAHVREADSLLATGLPLGAALRARALAFGDTFLLHTVGVGLFARPGWAEVARGLALALVAVPGIVRAGWRRWETWLLVAWAVLVAGQIYFLEALDRPRLMLPLLPPLALLVARGWARLRPRGPGTRKALRVLPAAVLTGAVFALLHQGLPFSAQLASVPAPSAQAAAHVAASYPAEQTLVAAAGSFRSVQVELPSYRLLYLYQFDADAALAATGAELIRYVVVFDRDKFPDDALAALSGDGRYVPLEDRTFARDPRVHTQGDQVRLQVLTPADRVPLEALALPPEGCIDVGGPEDGRYLDRGWYRPEEIGGVAGRWAGGPLTTTVRLYLEADREYRLAVRALTYPAAQELSVRVGGQVLDRFVLQPDWAEYAVAIPAALVARGEATVIELVHARVETPFDATGGASSDSRALAAAYDWICVSADVTP
jgi:hypothetical protein